MVLSGTDWVPGVGARAPVYNAVCSVQRTTESFFSQKSFFRRFGSMRATLDL